MRQTPWEKVTFRSKRVYGHFKNGIIMPRECIVERNPYNENEAFTSIREWVQEQAITIGEQSITNTALELLEMWRHTPRGHDIVFTLLSTTGDVFYCRVEYENDEERRELRNRHPRRIRECRVNKTSRTRRSTVRGQIGVWVRALQIFDNARGMMVADNLLLEWDRLPETYNFIVFKFVVSTLNFVYSYATIRAE